MDIMLDLETLGTTPGSVILSIGAVAFDRDAKVGEELLAGFYNAISVEQSKALGLTVDAATIDWWKAQSPEAQAVFADCALNGVKPVDACIAFNDFVEGVAKSAGVKAEDVKVWGNGSIFDNNLLAILFRKAGVRPVWEWYNDLCFRTLRHLVAVEPPQRVGTFHNALDDAKTQALHAVRIMQKLAQL